MLAGINASEDDRAPLFRRDGLDQLFFLCSHLLMMRIDPVRVARALLDAPGWARVGLTAPTEIIREAAAQELALTIARIDGEVSVAPDPNQLVLAL